MRALYKIVAVATNRNYLLLETRDPKLWKQVGIGNLCISTPG